MLRHSRREPATQRMNSPSIVPDGLQGQPHAIVERDGVRYTLLGTAHVSQASV